MTELAPPRCTTHSNHHAGCPSCKTWAAYQGRRRHRLIAYGQWRGLVDSADARAHILALHKTHDMSLRAIAAAAGCSRGCIERLASDKPPAQIHAKTHDAILAAQPAGEPRRVDSLGTARRLQALTAIGHDKNSLAARIGIGPARVARLRRQWKPTVDAATAATIAAVYDQIEGTPGTSSADRAFARHMGWAAPLAWDDAIDDPHAEPEEMLTDAVTLALAGQMTADDLAPAERLAVVRRLIRRRWTDRQIADLLGWVGGRQSVAHYRSNHHLAPGMTRMGPRPRNNPYVPPKPPVVLSTAKTRRVDTWAVIDQCDEAGMTTAEVVAKAGCSERTVWRRRKQRDGRRQASLEAA